MALGVILVMGVVVVVVVRSCRTTLYAENRGRHEVWRKHVLPCILGTP